MQRMVPSQADLAAAYAVTRILAEAESLTATAPLILGDRKSVV